MLLTNTEHIAGRSIKMLGFVQGVAIYHGSSGGAAGTYGVTSLKASGGGADLLTTQLEKTREEAQDAMRANAKMLGADAIVNVRYHSAMVSGNEVEILYTGTAVKYAATHI